MMNLFDRVVIWIRRLIKGCKQKFEVWDASAVSMWLDRLQEKIESENDLIIIVPETVMSQLFDDSNKSEGADKAHKYLLDCQNEKLKFATIAPNNRTLTVEEQLLSVVEEYYIQGYNVTFVTCNHNMAFRAKLRELNCLLYQENRVDSEQNTFVRIKKN